MSRGERKVVKHGGGVVKHGGGRETYDWVMNLLTFFWVRSNNGRDRSCEPSITVAVKSIGEGISNSDAMS